MKSRSIITLVSTILFLSCGFQGNEPGELQLSYDLSIGQLSDTTYLVDVRSIIVEDDLLYLVDYENNHVAVLDVNGSLQAIIGRKGHGPGEFLEPGQIFVHDDTLYVFNAGKNAIDVFHQTHYLKTVSFNETEGRYAGGRFFIDSETIYIPLSKTGSNFSVVPLKEKEMVRSFGNIEPFKSERQTLFQNFLNGVFLHENNLLTVFSSLPKVDRLTSNGELVEVFSFADITILQEQLLFSQSKLHLENVTVNLVTDSYLRDDLLYILFTHREGEWVFTNRVLVLDVSGKTIEVSKMLNLGDGWFNAIGVSKEHLWAFCRKEGSVLRFPL